MGFKASTHAGPSLLRGIEHHLVQRNEIANNPLDDLLRCGGNCTHCFKYPSAARVLDSILSLR